MTTVEGLALHSVYPILETKLPTLTRWRPRPQHPSQPLRITPTPSPNYHGQMSHSPVSTESRMSG